MEIDRPPSPKPERQTYGVDSLLPWSLVRGFDPERDGPLARQIDGAVLIVDIVGYTGISERLCDLGDEGLGRLSGLLNREFSRYLDIVAAHGGEIVSFAGDALIACFCDGEPVPDACRRARACAEALAGLSGATPDDGSENVTLRLGVAAGPIWVARLGGWYGRWELLVGGEATRSAFAAAAAASPGQVVVRDLSGRAARSAGAAPVREPPAAVLAPGPLPGTWIDGWVHPRLLDDARAAAPPESELRQVCALFVRATGLEQAGHDVLERHQEWIFAVHETLPTISAASGRFLIDDRGLVFVLVLGDPGNARANNLDRALSCGLALMPRARALNLGLSMGLSVGRAFCGVIGNRVRRQYVAIGPPMNRAARLMDARPQGFLASLPLPAHRMPHVKVISAGTLALKGLREPIPIARVEETAPAEHPRSFLHGRASQKRELQRLLAAAQQGHGHPALIVGEAGAGKSSLVAWLGREASALGVRCLAGEGDLAEAASSYFAFRPVVRALLGGTGQDGAGALRPRLAAWLQSIGRSAELAPLFNAVLPIHLPETAITEQLRGQTRAEVLIDLLVELVRGASVEPLIIVIEDAHWMDSASAALVEQIVGRLDRPLVLLTARPEADERLTTLQSRREKPVRLDLGPLAVEAIAALAATSCGDPVDARAIALIHEQTQGNPFFVQEYVRELRETHRLIREDGRWRLMDPETALATMPATLEGVITSRIDALPREAQAVLQTASVLGQQIDLAILARILPEAQSTALGPALELLQSRQLVAVEPGRADGGLRIAHALIQSVVYDSLLFERRKEIHRAIAEEIERRPPALGHHVRLVHHWSRAREMGHAVAHAEQAAEESIRAGAYQEARSFAQLCVDQAAREPGFATRQQQMRWQLALADAATGLGDVSGRGHHATCALTLAGRSIPRWVGAGALGGAMVLAMRGLRRWLGAAPVRSDPIIDSLTRAYRQLVVVGFFESQPPLYVLGVAAQAMVHAERGAQRGERSGALAEIGAWFGFAGLEPLARHYFDRAFRLADPEHDRPAAAFVSMVHGLYSVGRGRWPAVLAGVDRCQALCLQVGDRVQWANAQTIRFWYHYYQGAMEAAESAAGELEACARESGHKQHMSWALRYQGLCALAGGSIDLARDRLARSFALTTGSIDRTGALSTQGSLALAHVLGGDETAGHALASDALDQLRAIKRPLGHAILEGMSDLAELTSDRLARHPDSLAVVADARAAVMVLRRQARVFPIATPAFRYWQARVRALLGGNPARPLRRALGAAQALGMQAEARRIQAAARWLAEREVPQELARKWPPPPRE